MSSNRKWQSGFHHGVLHALAVLVTYDEPTIAKEIVACVDRKKLLYFADEYDMENLRKLGIVKRTAKSGGKEE